MTRDWTSPIFWAWAFQIEPGSSTLTLSVSSFLFLGSVKPLAFLTVLITSKPGNIAGSSSYWVKDGVNQPLHPLPLPLLYASQALKLEALSPSSGSLHLFQWLGFCLTRDDPFLWWWQLIRCQLHSLRQLFFRKHFDVLARKIEINKNSLLALWWWELERWRYTREV